MNAGRFAGASIAVFVFRTILNYLFYGVLVHGRYVAMDAAHPGVLREVIPAYITLDLITAVILTYLIVKAGAAFGGGIKGGVILGILVAILAPIVGGLYFFFGVTYYPADFFATEAVYQIVTHAVQGAIAAAIYKSA
jgi:hypothetical protein